jgi:hypothetical protein
LFKIDFLRCVFRPALFYPPTPAQATPNTKWRTGSSPAIAAASNCRPPRCRLARAARAQLRSRCALVRKIMTVNASTQAARHVRRLRGGGAPRRRFYLRLQFYELVCGLEMVIFEGVSLDAPLSHCRVRTGIVLLLQRQIAFHTALGPELHERLIRLCALCISLC